MQLGWYLRRLQRMSPAEVGSRSRDFAVKAMWAARQVKPGTADILPSPVLTQAFPKPLQNIGAVDDAAKAALLEAADAALAGNWRAFAFERSDFQSPDWFFDPSTGIRAPHEIFAFRYPHRDPARVGNLKYVWEASRHQHLTVLAAAFFVTRASRYAERIAGDLQDWWATNPFLSGPHWISGIELGMRLMSWVWCRRLLNDWPGAPELFERNPVFQIQLYRHQQYLQTFRSKYSSANNHVIAEAAGQLTAACAFPLFAESAEWRQSASHLLERELALQTFPSGLNRELASEYHGFVLELCLAAALEAQAADHPVSDDSWHILRDMTDVMASIVDAHSELPRQGDADDASGLLLDAPDFKHAGSLLRIGAALFGAPAWWRGLTGGDVRSTLMSALAKPPALSGERPSKLSMLARDAGMVLLRAGEGTSEIWCRGDCGPHGFLSTAAHAHADALSIELRVGGVEVLVDPGTYCYHTDPAWRRFFKSTAAHNTVELFGRDQSTQSGPFMWSDHAKSRLIAVEGLTEGDRAHWSAEHDGYAPVIHRRAVTLDRCARTLTIVETISGGDASGRMMFVLGPSVDCDLVQTEARLSWPVRGGTSRAIMRLPRELKWRASAGCEDPIEGWYSVSFGRKERTIQLIGEGNIADGQTLTTLLEIA